jgi:hypothetical protein
VSSAPPSLPRHPAPSGVIWIRDQGSQPRPLVLPAARERSERTTAVIVGALTLACTALAIYDLALLAAGASG